MLCSQSITVLKLHGRCVYMYLHRQEYYNGYMYICRQECQGGPARAADVLSCAERCRQGLAVQQSHHPGH